MHFDVFNGDADGIIALLQLRLAEPKHSKLITGVKRDISLLKQVPIAEASSVTVLDISMEKNTEALNALLANKVPTFYVDHHRTGVIPESENLTALINTDANTCTSLIVNEYLSGQFVHWAIAAAFGDNMRVSAQQLADKLPLTSQQVAQLAELGTYINYNGYGRTIEDLHFQPAALYQQLLNYSDPLTLIAETDSIFHVLRNAYHQDMQQAQSAEVLFENNVVKVVSLADEAWARRVSGVFGNELANSAPTKAHAVLTKNEDESFTVSVRAPLENKQGADVICSQFVSGGGRAAAAGVNQLPLNKVDDFIQTMAQYYQA
jgi:hypothetical protein